MLILTRRAKDKISFPQLGITIHFIRVVSGQAKVGIDAPREVVIVRDEVSDTCKSAEQIRRQLLHLPKDVRHGIRNELHEISIAIHLYKELMKASQLDEADGIFEILQDALQRLDENEVLKRPEPDQEIVDMSNKIVLIEDCANERDMLAGFLRLKGFDVTAFENGLDAINYFEDHEAPQIVLMDMRMPRLGGPETVRQLRATSRFDQTSIFAISGTTQQENGLEVGKRGVDQWFLKPLNSKSLVNAIETTFSASAANRITEILTKTQES